MALVGVELETLVFRICILKNCKKLYSWSNSSANIRLKLRKICFEWKNTLLSLEGAQIIRRM